MTAGKRALAAAPTPPQADPLALAAADLRETAARMRDDVTEILAELRSELDLARAERRAHAELVAERDALREDNRQSQRAVLLLLDREAQRMRPADQPAISNGSTDVH